MGTSGVLSSQTNTAAPAPPPGVLVMNKSAQGEVKVMTHSTDRSGEFRGLWNVYALGIMAVKGHILEQRHIWGFNVVIHCSHWTSTCSLGNAILYSSPRSILNFYFWPQGGVSSSLMLKSSTSSVNPAQPGNRPKPTSSPFLYPVAPGLFVCLFVSQVAAFLKKIWLTYFCRGDLYLVDRICGKICICIFSVFSSLLIIYHSLFLTAWNRSIWYFDKCLSWATHRLACEWEVPEAPAQKLTFQLGIHKVPARDAHRRKHTSPVV